MLCVSVAPAAPACGDGSGGNSSATGYFFKEMPGKEGHYRCNREVFLKLDCRLMLTVLPMVPIFSFAYHLWCVKFPLCQ